MNAHFDRASVRREGKIEIADFIDKKKQNSMHCGLKHEIKSI